MNGSIDHRLLPGRKRYADEDEVGPCHACQGRAYNDTHAARHYADTPMEKEGLHAGLWGLAVCPSCGKAYFWGRLSQRLKRWVRVHALTAP